ncbi:MAG: transglutaminase-like cysteine peptidase [Rhizobiaceae bacterium]|nr:transglutaminase-like cysteine peptidase [Rhizobiaceae bacterium]
MNKVMGTPLVLAMVVGAIGMAAPAGAGQNAMKTGARTTQPIGHYELCQQYTQECRQKTPKRAPTELTRKLWATLISVNNHVNSTVAPRTDMEMWGVEEKWSFPKGEGDCEDYALEKRRLLMAKGVPAGDLLITVVRQRNGDGHAVLTVRTSLGDFILDNLEGRILAWSDTDYTYIKRQSELNSGVWVKINDGRADAVASVE